MKKKKIILIIILLIIIISVLTFFTVRYFTHKKNVTYVDLNDIKNMEISVNDGYLSPTYTYKFDFLNNSIMHKTEDYDKNETFYTEFTDKDAEYFIKKANSYGFFNWEKSYKNNSVHDGKWADISIEFKDDSVHETYCYAEFPPDYDKMAEVFYEAFGYNIL